MKAKSILEELESFSWKDVNQLIKLGELKFAKRPFSKETYEFVAKEKNYTTVVQIAFISLQKHDPENANLEYAAKLADAMQELARKIIKDKNNKNK